MAKKPSPSDEAAPDPRPDRNEVEALRAMSRDDRLALLMRDFDATSGVAPNRRRMVRELQPAKTRRKP